MKKSLSKIVAANLILIVLASVSLPVRGQSNPEVFRKIEMLSPTGDKIKEVDVRIRFAEDALQIESPDGSILKTFKYADIKNAEYSYSKNPRWKTGLGLGAAGLVFPPLLLIAIPLGFTKHRRHWFTVRTEKDYAVLKLSKSVRKIFIPAFESRSQVKVEALGENK